MGGRGVGRFILNTGWPAHHQEVAHLAEETPLGAGTADVLGQVGAVHRATDPTLGQETRPPPSLVAKKSVVEIAKSGGKVLLGLGGKQQRQVAARADGPERI